MALLGQGMLVTFTEVPDAWEDELNEWYDREHVAERIALQGFRRARRYIAAEGTEHPRYAALYETVDVADLRAPAYLDLLADQSPWSKRVMAQFTLFDRLTCRVLVDRAQGIGAAITMLRFVPPDDVGPELGGWLEKKALPLAAGQPGMVGGWAMANDLDAMHAPLVHRGEPVPEDVPVEWLIVLEGADTSITRAVGDGLLADDEGAELLEGAPVTRLSYRFIYGDHR